MSRLLLLVIILIWLNWAPVPANTPLVIPAENLVLFLGVFAALVLGMGVWSRVVARKVAANNLHRSMRRFTRTLSFVRSLIPAWFIIGVCLLNWKDWVIHAVGASGHFPPVELPLTILGTLPAFVAWAGLWWAQYPADRSLREQSMLIQLDQDLPIHAPPTFWSYFASNLRVQLLFTVVPVLAIMFLRDLAATGFWLCGYQDIPGPIELIVSFSAAAAIFIFAPAILKRILHTEPLREPILRERLETICRRHRLRYRDILLWRTNHNMGNAAVMGLIPAVRYILMSDLLLETMNDEQIESVFAHEVGHIVHRHLMWYVIFVFTLMCAIVGPGKDICDLLIAHLPRSILAPGAATHPFLDMAFAAVGTLWFFLLFGLLSRRFERQADVFAARTMQSLPVGAGLSPSPDALGGFGSGRTEVGQEPDPPKSGNATTGENAVSPRGAAIFSSALYRVAAINNIPISSRRWSGGSALQFCSFFLDRAIDSANNFLHGSITYRTDYLEKLAADPRLTPRFDRFMSRLYVFLFLSMIVFLSWCIAAHRI